MGLCLSSVYEKYPHLLNWRLQFESLKLTEKDIRILYSKFRKVDLDKSGTIHIVELLTFFDLERTKFTERVFGIFDEDGSGCIDFREFVVSLWNYCTLTNATLALFAFDLYDKDSSGIIESKEVELMLKEIYGKKFSQNTHAMRINDKIESITLKDVNKDVFREFTKKHPALLFPAFEMQRVLQKHCLGSKFWKRITQKRIELSDGKFLSVGEIVELINHKTIQKHMSRDGDERSINLDKYITNQGNIRKISVPVNSINSEQTDGEISSHSNSLHQMVNTISMASHSKRKSSTSKIINPSQIAPLTNEPFIDATTLSATSKVVKRKPNILNGRQTYPLAQEQSSTSSSIENSFHLPNNNNITGIKKTLAPLVIEANTNPYNVNLNNNNNNNNNNTTTTISTPHSITTPTNASGLDIQKPRRRSKDSLGPIKTPTNRNSQQQQQQQQQPHIHKQASAEKRIRRRTLG